MKDGGNKYSQFESNLNAILVGNDIIKNTALVSVFASTLSVFNVYVIHFKPKTIRQIERFRSEFICRKCVQHKTIEQCAYPVRKLQNRAQLMLYRCTFVLALQSDDIAMV